MVSYTPGAELPAIYLPQTIITRHHHSSRFILPAANTTIVTKPASFTALKDWNDLPLNFYSIPTLSIFTSTINAHIQLMNSYNIIVRDVISFAVFPLIIIMIIIIS